MLVDLNQETVGVGLVMNMMGTKIMHTNLAKHKESTIQKYVYLP